MLLPIAMPSELVELLIKFTINRCSCSLLFLLFGAFDLPYTFNYLA